ncbi:MAG: UDP-N-acetylglucosamine 1-carboxyvinyltransferase [Corallococcus sp.]|nr:UDP-N-acetylglucosamine 1-carboxyvinyltransferase [Corallococcus sp.]MCM1359277.1 UDP-N-acetylglucosamine 1-carboxyvinyltransferase [Corallococcus sp.]MCM1394669.1 UDP-N-acetylglucosamine 1-carboxyvinyltransferase [Corallococcus sp.]
MDYIVNGKQKLNGVVSAYGAKNCALAMFGATVLTDDAVTLFGVPDIIDVENMLQLLSAMGKKIQRDGETVTVSGYVTKTDIPANLAKLLRGSALLLGSMVGRFGQVFLPLTGGCAIGKRPIDIHLDGLMHLGIEVKEKNDGVKCVGTPQGANFNLRFASVGATENLLCAATLANGTTVLTNCALEPEVEALERLLVKMGADVRGIGTSTLTIRGVQKLHGAEVSVIPDRIVVATYLCCVASAGGKVTVANCIPQHLKALLDILKPRFQITEYEDAICINAEKTPKDYGQIVTSPYPYFPTDMQQLMLSLCAASDGGVSHITENLFENRLEHNAGQLNNMGAVITVDGNNATIVGKRLQGATVQAMDLRGGAGLVVAALGAEGQTKICDVKHVLRGYRNFEVDLHRLGADIKLHI